MDNKIKYIKFNEQTKWLFCENQDRYFFMNLNEKGGTPLTTPGGKLVTTLYRSLAERIFDDLNTYGLENMSVKSIIPWHFTMVDNFANMDKKDIIKELSNSFLQHEDWTFTDGLSIENWAKTFGSYPERKTEIISFMDSLTNMQLTAMCCIANAHESLNLAFVLAKIMENFDIYERNEKFSLLAEMMSSGVELMYNDYMADFKTFQLYYGIHMNEDKTKTSSSNIYRTTLEDLIGRNYYHYTNGKLDQASPEKLDLDCFMLEISHENNGEADRKGNISEFLPEACWVKVLRAGDDVYHHVVLDLDTDFNIKKVFVLEETAENSCNGILREGKKASSFKKLDEIPLMAGKELENLFAGRSVKKSFKLIGSRLPSEFIAEYEADENTYSYANGSPFRDTFMQMEIETDDDGTVRGVEYSTFNDYGDGLDAMFSKPEPCDDREDELIELLVDIIDLYTEEEFKALVK